MKSLKFLSMIMTTLFCGNIVVAAQADQSIQEFANTQKGENISYRCFLIRDPFRSPVIEDQDQASMGLHLRSGKISLRRGDVRGNLYFTIHPQPGPYLTAGLSLADDSGQGSGFTLYALVPEFRISWKHPQGEDWELRCDNRSSEMKSSS